MKDFITPAVQDAVAAAGIAPWDARRTYAVARATRALKDLDEAAGSLGSVVRDTVRSGYFKLSANEPHRLAKLVDSIVRMRTDAVIRSLVDYDQNH